MVTLTKQISTLERRVEAIFEDLSDYFSKGQVVDYATLQRIPYGATVQLAEGVKSTRLEGTGRLSFYTTMDAGAILGAHFHDAYEAILLKQGRLLDLSTSQTISRSAYIPPDVIHMLMAPVATDFDVHFYPV